MQAIRREVERLGADAIACVVTTTSCFAPRAADDVVAGGALGEGSKPQISVLET